MTVTYNLDTDVGKVRLLADDRDGDDPAFQDEEVEVFLALEGGVFRGAALALETMASDTTVASLGDQSVDKARSSAQLLSRAAELRKRADDADAAEGGQFDWAEWAFAPFSTWERLYAEGLRSLP